MKKRLVKLTEHRRVKLDFDTLCRVDTKKAMMILLDKLTKQGVVKCR